MSSSSASPTELEIVELSSGEIVLRSRDGEQNPLVTVRFSSEVRHYLGQAVGDVGKAMIGAGVELVGEMQVNKSTNDVNREDMDPARTLH